MTVNAKKYNIDDTIAAISTPIGSGAIGIVRLSGKDSIAIADKIFRAKSGKPLKALKSFEIAYGRIVDEGKVADEVIVSVMKGPKSYTREDIVEINCHSGLATLKKILELVIKFKARFAEPGEFTKRAFLNGRIDLVQAEAVLDIIASKTEDSLGVALGQLGGILSKKINELKIRLLSALVNVEVVIDFPEEDIETDKIENIKAEFDYILKEIENLVNSSGSGIILRDGLKCAICGKPNVGKSSLMNALLKKDRSIVTDIPGTTRDTIEETSDIKGIPVNFIDTAGIADSSCVIEKEGIARTKSSLKKSDFVIFVLDGNSSIQKEDEHIADEIKDLRKIIVINKIDLGRKTDAKIAGKLLPGTKIVEISALLGTNIKKLEDAIEEIAFKGKPFQPDEAIVSNLRHKASLINASDCIVRAKDAIGKLSLEFIAADLNEAINYLNEIIGEEISDDIMERIFSQFCIGK